MGLRTSIAALGSLQARLIGILAILGTLLLGFSLQAVWQTRTRMMDAEATTRVVPDRILISRFAAAVGGDMLDVYAAMLATASFDGTARDALLERIRNRDATVDAGLSDMADRAAAAAIARTVVDHRAVRQATLEEASRSAFVRDLGQAKAWLAASEAVLVSLDERGDRSIPLEAISDAEMAAYLSLLQEVERLKYHVTVRGTLVGGHIASRSYHSIAAARRMELRTGKIDLASGMIADRVAALERDGDLSHRGDALADALADHRQRYAALFKTDDGPADGASDPWYASVAALLEAADRFEDGAIARLTDHVRAQRASASAKLAIAAALGLVAIVLVAASAVVVLHGIVVPLRDSVAQLVRLARGDLELDTKHLPQHHEFGALRHAIERLGRELRGAETLKGEAEAHRLADERRKAAAVEDERRVAAEQQAADRASQEAAEARRLREADVARDVAVVAKACAEGDFDRRAETGGREGVFLDLCEGINAIGAAAAVGLHAIEGALDAVARGDLTPLEGKDHAGIFGRLLSRIDETNASLGVMIRSAADGASRITSDASRIADGAGGIAHRSQTSARAVQDIATAMSQIAETVAATAQSAERTREIARQTDTAAADGVAAADRTSAAMAEIERLSDEIAGKIVLIEEIAFQTNLLALNAGVEAARAGAAGAGFKVVAMEVRSLASRASEAAESIGGLIERSGQAVQNGAALVQDTGTTFRDIAAATTALSEEAANVADAARQQSDAMSELDGAVGAIEGDIKENTTMFETMLETTHRLDAEAQELTHAFGQFTTAAPIAEHRRPASTRSAVA